MSKNNIMETLAKTFDELPKETKLLVLKELEKGGTDGIQGIQGLANGKDGNRA